MTLEHVVRVRGARGEGQDRIATVPCAGGLRIVLADGAGGTARGGEAAQRVVDRLSAGVDVDTLDGELAALGGQSTVVAIEITGDSIHGTSVGDSEAWIVGARGKIEVLTARQYLKPLLGDGGIAVAFSGALAGGTLVVGSDGLFKYVKREVIVAACARHDLAEVADVLLAATELPGGGLQDDVSLVICRAAG